MTDDLTHTVTIIVNGHLPTGDRSKSMISIAGNGNLEHMLDAFRTALVGAGFSGSIAERLDILDEESPAKYEAHE